MQPERMPAYVPQKPVLTVVRAPRVTRLRTGKPCVLRVPRPKVLHPPLPPDFEPRFPDEVDLLADRPSLKRWPTHYYIIAAVLHLIAFGGFGYYRIMGNYAANLPKITIHLPPTPNPGEGIAPVAPEPSSGAKRLDKLASAAPTVAPAPLIPKGVIAPQNPIRLPHVPPMISGISPASPSFPAAAVPSTTHTGEGGTADVMSGRRSGVARGAAVARYGGSDASEAAVLKALRWLKQNRNETGERAGSWGKQYPVAMTALALLELLGHG